MPGRPRRVVYAALVGLALPDPLPAAPGEWEVLLNTGPIHVVSAEAAALRGVVGAFEGKRLHLVQFAGPIQPRWLEDLEATGVEVVHYVPAYAYLVYGDSLAVARVQELARTSPGVRWDGAYLERHKVQAGAQADARAKRGLAADRDIFAIQLVRDPDANAATVDLIQRWALAPLLSRWEILKYVNLEVELPIEAIASIAACPDVVSVDRRATPRKFDERQDRILFGHLTGGSPQSGDYLAYLAGKGFTQAQFASSNFVVDVTDSGIDNATGVPNHFGLRVGGSLASPGRVQYNRLVGTPNPGSTLLGCDGHGTLNAHVVAGYVPDPATLPIPAAHADASGFRYGLGVCPFVKVGSSVIFDPEIFTNPNLPNLQASAYADQARISSNSWGADVGGSYNAVAQTFDALVRDAQPSTSTFPAAGNQEMVVVFAAGNAGPAANTVGSPGTAKNVITVGATEGVQAFGGEDNCAIGDAAADRADDMAAFSSRGPADDGRVKPDLVAPGSHITGGVYQETATSAGTGVAASCFDGGGVCGGPAASLFFPPTQQFYTASSGTSHATPAVAGGAALVRQHFVNLGLDPPSPAMTKALLVNSARHVTGAGANDTLPSNVQGMGVVNLGAFFDLMGGPGILRDQLAADTFTSSGQVRAIAGNVADPGQPFRVTLAWTDAPGSTIGAAYVNDLDLVVTVGGRTYRGNVFAGPGSVVGGSPDPRNNLESVFLPAGESGPFAVQVVATNIAGDGVPNVGGPLDQDYALVIANANLVNQAVLTMGAATTVADQCVPSNGVPDPGETVTLSLCVRNVGTRSTSNALGALEATGGVTVPSGVQAYGALATGGPEVCRPFTFTVASLTCGAEVSPTLTLEDGSTSLGRMSWSLTTGLPRLALVENFDGVPTPALPPGWTSLSESGGDLWTTLAANPVDSPPNAAVINGPGGVSLTSLVMPSLFLPLTVNPIVLSFRNSFDLEAGFDGGVLEVKVGTGPFQDVLAAGGAFRSGGYTHTLGAGFGNPLPGRLAWSGNSGGYRTSTVELPAALGGQSVQFRWRRGSDNNTAGVGWRIDTITVEAGRNCCPGAPGMTADLGITKSDGQTTYTPGRPLTYTVVASNAGPSAVNGAIVTDNVPASLVGAGWTCSASAGSSCRSPAGSGGINTPVDLLPSGTATISLAATVSSAATGNISNTASVVPPAGVVDPRPADNSATDVDNPVPGMTADLGITKSDGQTTYTPGRPLTYTVVASNAGPSAVNGAIVTDNVPASLVGAGWTCSASAGSSCRSPAGSGGINTPVDLLPSGTATFSLAATVSSAATGNISNTASVVPPAGVVDPRPADNSATDVDNPVRGSYFTVTPCRLADTRGGAALVAGGSRTFSAAGQCGIPATATAVSLNLTAVTPTAAGFLQIVPTGSPVPTVSAINYSAGQTRANNGVYALGADGQLDVRCGQATGSAHLVIDVSGYFVE